MLLRESEFVKIRVAVPVPQADEIRRVLNEAGASRQGNYEFASGSARIVGRFRPRAGAQPAIGRVGQIEEVEEEVIETLCHRDMVAAVVAAVRKAHPYEEPPIDIIPRLEVD
ncbi:MAG: hypothetical protein HYZ09_00670 [Candidatus Kerfeldbacteria bacterium]|nr:hypothetical protein [Candidatus Kerfeldbacteria bacterium]